MVLSNQYTFLPHRSSYLPACCSASRLLQLFESIGIIQNCESCAAECVLVGLLFRAGHLVIGLLRGVLLPGAPQVLSAACFMFQSNWPMFGPSITLSMSVRSLENNVPSALWPLRVVQDVSLSLSLSFSPFLSNRSLPYPSSLSFLTYF